MRMRLRWTRGGSAAGHRTQAMLTNRPTGIDHLNFGRNLLVSTSLARPEKRERNSLVNRATREDVCVLAWARSAMVPAISRIPPVRAERESFDTDAVYDPPAGPRSSPVKRARAGLVRLRDRSDRRRTAADCPRLPHVTVKGHKPGRGIFRNCADHGSQVFGIPAILVLRNDSAGHITAAGTAK